jgi:hypothetical protein
LKKILTLEMFLKHDSRTEIAEGVSMEGKVWPRAAAVGERLWSDPTTGKSN